jgi:hypothetical protein
MQFIINTFPLSRIQTEKRGKRWRWMGSSSRPGENWGEVVGEVDFSLLIEHCWNLDLG